MKKFYLLLAFLVLGVSFGFSLILGPPIMVECVKCGAKKNLMSIVSGNTFGAIEWSDLFLDAPMLPRISPIQKCDSCNALFIIKKADIKRSDNPQNISQETGRLSWNEIKNIVPFLNDSTLSSDDQYAARLEILQRFNDAFRFLDTNENDRDREENLGIEERTEADWELHRQNIEGIVALFDAQNPIYYPLIAEFYREAGRFDEALILLEDYQPTDDVAKFTQTIKAKALEKDFKVFPLQDEDERN